MEDARLSSPISNWVILQPGVQKVLRFSDHRITTTVITDPITRGSKTVEALQFSVIEEDGSPVSRSFSVISQKLAGELGPYLVGNRYLSYRFTFIKDSPGPTPPRIASVVPV
jgi:hypothetical protein